MLMMNSMLLIENISGKAGPVHCTTKRRH